MARDVRELILQRLKAILESIDGTVSTWRDRQDVDPKDTPTLILLDGSESKRTTTAGGGHTRMPPAVMEMTPGIWVQVKPRTDADNPGVGEELSAWRVKILRAIFNDAQLAVLQGENGELEYRGVRSDMEIGAIMVGNEVIQLALTYLFDPDDMT
jgi:hypothetical protein